MRRSPELLRFWIRSFGFEHVSLLLYFQTGHRSVTNLNAVSHGIAALLSFSRRSRFLSCDTCAVFLRGCVIFVTVVASVHFSLKTFETWRPKVMGVCMQHGRGSHTTGCMCLAPWQKEPDM